MKLLDTVLVAAAALDGVLRNLLLVVMRGLSNNKAEQIFGSHRPLYHLSPKIDIAYAFEVIDEDLYSDLRIIKDIRNKFAHPEGPYGFPDAQSYGACSRLQIVDLGQRWVRLVRSTGKGLLVKVGCYHAKGVVRASDSPRKEVRPCRAEGISRWLTTTSGSMSARTC